MLKDLLNKLKLKSKILIIAGSDSSGGAGIQADIKTVSSLGSYALTAITAVTVQNTRGVKSVIPIPPNEIKNQIIYNNSKSNNLKLSFQSEYVFKQNEFPNNDFTVFIPQTERFELVELSTPPKAYQLLNF